MQMSAVSASVPIVASEPVGRHRARGTRTVSAMITPPPTVRAAADLGGGHDVQAAARHERDEDSTDATAACPSVRRSRRCRRQTRSVRRQRQRSWMTITDTGRAPGVKDEDGRRRRTPGGRGSTLAAEAACTSPSTPTGTGAPPVFGEGQRGELRSLRSMNEVTGTVGAPASPAAAAPPAPPVRRPATGPGGRLRAGGSRHVRAQLVERLADGPPGMRSRSPRPFCEHWLMTASPASAPRRWRAGTTRTPTWRAAR